MKTEEIEKATIQRSSLALLFKGCIASNQLSQIKTNVPGFWLVNFDTIQNSGTHWVVIVVLLSKQLNYFDAACLHPPYSIAEWLQRNNVTRKLKKAITKKTNKTCGEWCLLFVLYRFRFPDVTFEGIIQILLTRLSNFSDTSALFKREFSM